MALMDPYGLTLFPVEWWGIVLGVTVDRLHHRRPRDREVRARAATRSARCCSSSIAHGHPRRALHDPRVVVAVRPRHLGCTCALIPAVEASEQTVIQKVVPFRDQGRVFGFAAALESAAAPDHRVPHRADRAVLDHPVHEVGGRPGRRGGGCSATATPAASRSCSCSAGSSWWCSRCSRSRPARTGCCRRSTSRAAHPTPEPRPRPTPRGEAGRRGRRGGRAERRRSVASPRRTPLSAPGR